MTGTNANEIWIASDTSAGSFNDVSTLSDAFSHDLLIGGALGDTINAGPGNDFIQGLGGNDVLDGGSGDDIISGGVGADTIQGGAGNDMLNGGAGADLLDGGADIDTVSYATEAAGITARLDLGFGEHSADGLFDTYVSIENVTGSNFNDVIVGDPGQPNALSGGTADDVIYGEGIDTVNGGAGNDVLFGGQGGALNLNLAVASIETVWGSIASDVMDGSAASANLTLVGQGPGADTMLGGSGDDFIYFRAGDIIDGGPGNDWAEATLSASGITLDMTAAHVENAWGSTSDDTVTAAGSASAAVIIGDTGNDSLTGGNAGDFLYGFDGNDTLNGGLGSDVLTGGAGADIFALGTELGTTNIDAITDFVAVDDTIQLENGAMTGLGTATGALTAAALVIGATAADASDRIIYNNVTGDLFYDADGTGATSAIKIATLNSGLAMTNQDFQIV